MASTASVLVSFRHWDCIDLLFLVRTRVLEIMSFLSFLDKFVLKDAKPTRIGVSTLGQWEIRRFGSEFV
jgi:hypothetical protein